MELNEPAIAEPGLAGLEELRCAFLDDKTNTPCRDPAQFHIWTIEDDGHTPSCKLHLGDLLGRGENRIFPVDDPRNPKPGEPPA